MTKTQTPPAEDQAAATSTTAEGQDTVQAQTEGQDTVAGDPGATDQPGADNSPADNAAADAAEEARLAAEEAERQAQIEADRAAAAARAAAQAALDEAHQRKVQAKAEKDAKAAARAAKADEKARANRLESLNRYLTTIEKGNTPELRAGLIDSLTGGAEAIFDEEIFSFLDITVIRVATEDRTLADWCMEARRQIMALS